MTDDARAEHTQSVDRMLFPADLSHRLKIHGFAVVDVCDNKDMTPTDLTEPTLYVAARYQSPGAVAK